MQTVPVSYTQMHIDQCVEYLCEQGCSKVNGYITALQNDQDVPGLGELSQFERQAVLNELIDVMAAYQDKCSR